MKRGSGLGLALLAVWAAWGFALQGFVASSPTLGRWTPDVGVVFLLALEARLAWTRALAATLVVAAARAAFTSDPALAIFVGYALVIGLAVRLRRVIEIDQPLPRALFAGLSAMVLAAYWSVARSAALAADGHLVARADVLEPRLGLAVATALAALLLSSWITRLPGLSLVARSSA